MAQALTNEFGNKPNKRDTGVSGLIVFLTFLWFVLAALGFGVIQKNLLDRIKQEANLVDALHAVSWPFVWFALGLPAAFILMNYMRQLISLKNALERAPESLEQSLKAAEGFSGDISEVGARINNDMTAVLDALDSRVTALREQLSTLIAAKDVSSASPADAASQIGQVLESSKIIETLKEDQSDRDELSDHVEYASGYLYSMLEKWNSDGRRQSNVLRVTPGGGNRPVLAKELLERRVAPFDDETSALIAQFEQMAFQEHLSARKRKVDKSIIEKLKSIREELVRREATPAHLKMKLGLVD